MTDASKFDEVIYVAKMNGRHVICANADEDYQAYIREDVMKAQEREALREANMNLKAENDRLRAAMDGARDRALVEAANLCKYHSPEWDHPSKTHELVKWSLNIGCAHAGHAYENAILALRTPDATPKDKMQEIIDLGQDIEDATTKATE